jgi:serine/threonine protein kinase
METDSKLINQGSYGCIYYPSLPFQLQRDKKNLQRKTKTATSTANQEVRSKYVSKLQKFNFHSDFEDYIGRKIQEIPSYELFFVPVLKTYKIDLATIKESHVTGCDAISKYIRRNTTNKTSESRQQHLTPNDYKRLNKHFIIQKMKYINGLYLHRYLLDVINNTDDSTPEKIIMSSSSSSSDSEASDDAIDADDHDHRLKTQQLTKTIRKDERQVVKYRTQFQKDEKNNSSYHFLSILFDLYERITDSIQLLIKYKIVHYDLKENNILIEKLHQLPYIIDFGLSIDVSRLQEHPWSEKQEEHSKSTIHSDILYHTHSSKLFQYNYLWRQHFYVHAPDYFLWPIEIHLMTYLINESDTLTIESLQRICSVYISNNKAIAYMSRDFKKKMFKLSVATFSRFVDKPRETVLNELLKYWDKWDIYAVNIMFLKIAYELLFHRESVGGKEDEDEDDIRESTTETTETTETSKDKVSLNEDRQQRFDPDHLSEKHMHFHTKYKVKLKDKYNNRKIMNTIQVMLRNIHPNPDKRMTPEETKAFFVSVFYEC